MLRRKAVEELVQRKTAMIAALNANPVFYRVENGIEEREKMIESYNNNCNEVIERIYDSRSAEEVSAAEREDPFIAAVDIGRSLAEMAGKTEDEVAAEEESGVKDIFGGGTIA